MLEKMLKNRISHTFLVKMENAIASSTLENSWQFLTWVHNLTDSEGISISLI